MQIEPIASISAGAVELIRPRPVLQQAVLRTSEGGSFGEALGSAVDSLAGALSKADALAASLASGKTNIAEASIARAKADVMLEVAAIAAARISGAITQLLQTQV